MQCKKIQKNEITEKQETEKRLTKQKVNCLKAVSGGLNWCQEEFGGLLLLLLQPILWSCCKQTDKLGFQKQNKEQKTKKLANEGCGWLVLTNADIESTGGSGKKQRRHCRDKWEHGEASARCSNRKLMAQRLAFLKLIAVRTLRRWWNGGRNWEKAESDCRHGGERRWLMQRTDILFPLENKISF